MANGSASSRALSEHNQSQVSYGEHWRLLIDALRMCACRCSLRSSGSRRSLERRAPSTASRQWRVCTAPWALSGPAAPSTVGPSCTAASNGTPLHRDQPTTLVCAAYQMSSHTGHIIKLIRVSKVSINSWCVQRWPHCSVGESGGCGARAHDACGCGGQRHLVSVT